MCISIHVACSRSFSSGQLLSWSKCRKREGHLNREGYEVFGRDRKYILPNDCLTKELKSIQKFSCSFKSLEADSKKKNFFSKNGSKLSSSTKKENTKWWEKYIEKSWKPTETLFHTPSFESAASILMYSLFISFAWIHSQLSRWLLSSHRLKHTR